MDGTFDAVATGVEIARRLGIRTSPMSRWPLHGHARRRPRRRKQSSPFELRDSSASSDGHSHLLLGRGATSSS
jgi:hypothetical protein